MLRHQRVMGMLGYAPSSKLLFVSGYHQYHYSANLGVVGRKRLSPVYPKQRLEQRTQSFSNFKAEIFAVDEFTVSVSKTFSSACLKMQKNKIKVLKERFHSHAVEEPFCVLQRTFHIIDLKRTISS